MRLLKVDTLEFVEFFEDRVPPYAILSHTWREEEVSYREMLQPITGATQAKEGYKKIKGFASLVSQTQWGYIWVDTCCINKDSSAELTEAINSMYRWYKNSGRCYVYLDDVNNARLFIDPSLDGIQGHSSQDVNEISPIVSGWDQFKTCRWKTRGWTLQELIAPIEVHFYTCGWDFIFTKAELIYEIADLLKIEVGVLLSSDPSTASIAQRMCWASSRTTSRSEDMAYCLMGLFDVNMPLLYGEGGEKAFLRLQEEILKTSEDNSIFAWTLQDAHWSFHAGLLATCPAQFRHSAHIEWQHWNTNEEQTLPAHTKMGVSLTMATYAITRTDNEPDLFLALLPNVTWKAVSHQHTSKVVGIFLKKLYNQQYARVDANKLYHEHLPPSARIVSYARLPGISTIRSMGLQDLRSIYVRQAICFRPYYRTSRIYGIFLVENFLGVHVEEFTMNADQGIAFCAPQSRAAQLSPGNYSARIYCHYKLTDRIHLPRSWTVTVDWNGLDSRIGLRCQENLDEELDRLHNSANCPIQHVRFTTEYVIATSAFIVMVDHKPMIKVSVKIEFPLPPALLQPRRGQQTNPSQ